MVGADPVPTPAILHRATYAALLCRLLRPLFYYDRSSSSSTPYLTLRLRSTAASAAISIDHPANAILLRDDVRTCLDANAFAFYPVYVDGVCEDGRNFYDALMVYFVKCGYQYLRDVFHRRRVAIPPDVPVEFLYARFAYAIVSMQRFDPVFEGMPEVPEVEEMRERIRRREQRERGDGVYV